MIDNDTGFKLTYEQRALIEELESRPRSFNEMRELLGLRSKTDFRYADLACVNFSEADLRGFDFTGANLHLAYGTNVCWDETTILNGTNLTGSIFAYRAASEEFFLTKGNDADFRVLQRLDWADQITLMYDFRKSPARSEQVGYFCKRLFLESDDAVVRADMLAILRGTENDTASYLSFLVYTCCTSRSPGQINSAAKVLADRFRNFKNAFEVLCLLRSRDENAIRETALYGIFRSKYFLEVKAEIAVAISTEPNGLTRRRYIEQVSQDVLDGKLVTKPDTEGQAVYDFAEPIHRSYILRQAARSAKSATDILRIIAELIEAGIPYKVADPDLRAAVENLRLLAREKRSAQTWFEAV